MSKKSYDAATIILGCIVVIPLIVGIGAFSGWVLMLLWNWALVGIFPAVPVLDFYKAWALSIFLSHVSI